MARLELDSVQHGDHLSHAERAAEVGVVVDGGKRPVDRRGGVVRARPLASVSHLLQTRVLVPAQVLFGCVLLLHQGARKLLDHTAQLLHLLHCVLVFVLLRS